MRPRHIPTSHGSAARIVLGFAVAFAALILIGFLTSCSPRAFSEVNKQAPDPPYAGQYHSGLDQAEYLRDKEPLDP